MQDINNGEGVPYYYPADYSPTEWITHEEYEKWRMKMPTRGKCWSCSEITFLTAIVVQNKETGSLLCAMVCEKCRKWYERDVKEEPDETE